MATQVAIERETREGGRAPVYVWQWPIRIAHWGLVLAITITTWTGFYLHKPLLEAHGPRAWYMGTARFAHELGGFLLIAMLLLRFYWFFVGNRWAHWRAFLPLRRRQWNEAGKMIGYYSFLRKDPIAQIGHNPLAAMTYLLIFALLSVEVVTGLVLFSFTSASPMLKTLVGWIPNHIDMQYIRVTHFGVMFIFIAFVLQHVYNASIVSMEEKSGVIESIFSGWKFVPKKLLRFDQNRALQDEAERRARSAKPRVRR